MRPSRSNWLGQFALALERCERLIKEIGKSLDAFLLEMFGDLVDVDLYLRQTLKPSAPVTDTLLERNRSLSEHSLQT